MVDGELVGINIDQEFQAGPEVYGSVFPENQLRSDCRYLVSKGFAMIRIPLKQWGSRPIDIAWQRTAAGIVKEYFESVSLGSGQHKPYNPEDWDDFEDFVLNDEIPWIISTNKFGANDVYMIANEIDFAMGTKGFASVSRSSNIVTCVYSDKHNLETGDGIHWQVDAIGVGSTQFSNERIVTKIDDYTFTVDNTGTDAAPVLNPSLSGNWWYYSTKTHQRHIKRLATKIKTQYPDFPLKLSYSILCSVVNNGDAESGSVDKSPYRSIWSVDHFAELGRGDLDYVDVNVYSYTSINYEKGLQYFRCSIDKAYAAFGPDHTRVTEWNLWHNTGAYYGNTPMAEKNIAERLAYLKSKTGLKHFFFCWREYHTWLQVLNPYNKTLEEGAKFRDWWYTFIGERQPTVEISNGNPISVTSAREMPAILKWEKVGFNMGQYEQSGAYNATQINNDLTFLFNAGVKTLRIAGGWSDYPQGVTACRNLALAARNKGFHVQKVFIGPLSDAAWSQYVTNCLAEAAWCVANDMQELCLGNEIEGEWNWAGPFTDIVNKIRSLATTVKAAYPSLKLTYAVQQDRQEADWISNGKGDIDVLGYNCYGSLGSFEDFKAKVLAFYNAFGVDGFQVTEWNLSNAWDNSQSEIAQVPELQKRFDFLELYDITNQFFTWNWPQSNDQFALKKADGTFRAWYEVFFQPIPREEAVGRELAVGRETI